MKDASFDKIISVLLRYEDDCFINQLEKHLRSLQILPEKLSKLRKSTPQQIYPLSASSQILKIQGSEIMDTLTLMGYEDKFINIFTPLPNNNTNIPNTNNTN